MQIINVVLLSLTRIPLGWVFLNGSPGGFDLGPPRAILKTLNAF
jgi:hypothetical protein